MRIRILMADDHELFRDGFAGMFVNNAEIELLDQSSNGEHLLFLVEKYRPDVVLTDIHMSPVDGFEVTRQIIRRYPGIAVIALTMYDEGSYIKEMLQAGASGYLVKNARKQTMIDAIKAAYRGENYYCQTASSQLSALIARGDYEPGDKQAGIFNATEIQIINMICKDHDTKEIAEKLKTSVGNINRYRQQILEKAGVRTPTALVIYAMRNGLVKW